MSMIQPGIFGPSGIVGQAENMDLDNAFAQFVPVPGGSIISNQAGEYPFANQATAANAIITQPLMVSMVMICPYKNPGEAFQKLSIITSLKQTLDQHILGGGLFAVATPSFFYTDCVMLNMRDASSGESKQAQYRWQLDFRKPLVTQAQAEAAHSALMNRLSNGTKVAPTDAATGNIAWSSPDNAQGGGGAASSVVPSTQSSPDLGAGSDMPAVNLSSGAF